MRTAGAGAQAAQMATVVSSYGYAQTTIVSIAFAHIHSTSHPIPSRRLVSPVQPAFPPRLRPPPSRAPVQVRARVVSRAAAAPARARATRVPQGGLRQALALPVLRSWSSLASLAAQSRSHDDRSLQDPFTVLCILHAATRPRDTLALGFHIPSAFPYPP